MHLIVHLKTALRLTDQTGARFEPAHAWLDNEGGLLFSDDASPPPADARPGDTWGLDTPSTPRSGDATPQPGDLEGSVKGVAAGARGVSVIVDTVRP